MDFAYNDEQKEIIKVVRDLVEKEIVPYASEMDETGKLHEGLLEKLAAQGLLGVAIPEEFGGAGLDAITIAAIYEELGKGCAGVATTVAANALASYPVIIAGNDDQKKRYFDIINEDNLAAFALTEPGTGSDAGSVSTRAMKTEDGKGYILNGTKCFITNGGVASVYTVFAITDKTKGVKGISAFIVERDRPGVSVGKEEDKMGIRLSNTTEVIFQDVHIPADHLIGEEGKGFIYAMQTLDLARPMVASLAVGIAQRAIDESVKYAKQRVTFGKPIIKHEVIAFKLADMDMKTEVARAAIINFLNTYYAVPKRNYTREAAIAKCFAGDMAVQVALEAVQILGGFGYSREYPVEKLVRDAKIMQIYEGTNEVQRMVIAGFVANK